MLAPQDVPAFITFVTFLIPAVFVFLWTLIFIDFNNFRIFSKKGYVDYTADDPINCYQKYVKQSVSAK